MGLVVADFDVPNAISVEEVATRLSERIGKPCRLQRLSGEGQTWQLVGPRAIWADATLDLRGQVLHSEAPLGTSDYFLLQLELAVADLGGSPRSIGIGKPRPARRAHSQATLTWRELPLRTRLAAGSGGRLVLGLLGLLVSVFLILTVPIQLLLYRPLRWWKQHRTS